MTQHSLITTFLFLLCSANVGMARRVKSKSNGVVNIADQKVKEAAETQSNWSYSNATTAWDVLCHAREAGVFGAKWKETGCWFCDSMVFKCDPDERESSIKVTWKGFGSKDMYIKKDALPVTTDGFAFRFFLESKGCLFGDGNSDEDCELPWEPFDTVRSSTKKTHITRRFLNYDAVKAGARVVSIATTKYEAWFYKSDVKTLGVGSPVPAEPIYAGATGTGCGVGLVECTKPVQGPEPMPTTQKIDVTTNYIFEHSDNPGYVSLMTNRNWAKHAKTRVASFAWEG